MTSSIRRPGVAALAAVLFSVFVPLAGPAAGEKPTAPPVRVVIIDGQNNHAWNQTTPQLKKALESCGRFTVAVSTSTQTDGKKPSPSITPVAFPPDLSGYDVVLSNYNGAAWPKEFQTALEERLAAGKTGLVIVHAADNSFPGWAEYNRMIGPGWRGSSFGPRLVLGDDGKAIRVEEGTGPGAGHGAQHPFKVVTRDPEHPVMKGLPAEWLHAQDELYHGLRGPLEGMHLLATAYSDKKTGGTGENEPMIWTMTYSKGRVFHTPMGHSLTAMQCLGFVTVLRRGTEWAATGEVTVPVPADFPTATKVSVESGK